MENRIPIDELFREKLGQGKEQMNLGAWANMERMLDGKNPYADEDGKKKRRFLPFFWMFLITTGIVGAGYLVKTNLDSRSQLTSKAISQPISQLSQDEINASSQHAIQPQSIASNIELSNSNSTQTNSTQPSRSNKTSNISNKQQDSQLENNITKNDNKNNTKQGLSNASVKENALAKTNSATSINPKQNQQDALQSASGLSSTKKANRSLKGKLSSSNLNPSGNSNNRDMQGTSQNDLNSSNTNQPTANAMVETKTNKVVEQFPMVTINQKTTRNRDGSIKSVSGDTVGISTYEKVTEYSATETTVASIDPIVSNPRFKKLTEQEELNARQLRKDETSQTSSATSEPQPEKLESGVSIANNQKIKKATKQTGYFEDLKKFANDTYNKISNFLVYTPKPKLHLGMMMGVNASLSNSKNNFGGFQAGLTTITPMTDYFSFLAEFKFFYRNNGGYTINDISYNILNHTKDEVTIAHNTIHSYVKDSTVKTYNFKNFYSLELPLMVQLNSRSFGFYGGVNLAYNFRLKTTSKTKNYKVEYLDTVASSMPYYLPIDKGSVVNQNDFASRFGLGYVVGASYNFSPKLGLDIRLAQNVWDNSQSASSLEISRGFFKVPSIQISLAYKFRDFIPNN